MILSKLRIFINIRNKLILPEADISHLNLTGIIFSHKQYAETKFINRTVLRELLFCV